MAAICQLILQLPRSSEYLAHPRIHDFLPGLHCKEEAENKILGEDASR